jgi:tRNA pseudouridine38-40 synthase
MPCYKLTIAYDGTNFSGWQIQPNATAIQELIQNALKIFLQQEKVVLIGSGRTDAGVHALAQVAHFRHFEEIDLKRLLSALNGILPRDIRVKNAEQVHDAFHSQYTALGKIYHYHLYLDQVMDPFRRLYCWHVHRKLDVSLLIESAACFVGTHDFTSFANESHAGSAGKDPVRTIYRLDVLQEPGGVRLEFEGNGFLYKMVRNIVGTMVDVATQKRPFEDIKEIFIAKDRRKASLAAPAQGLFLVQVHYP